MSKDKETAKALIDEADSFMLVTGIEKVDEDVADGFADAKSEQRANFKAYLLASPERIEEMIEYLFKRFPDIPDAVIELRGDEMKEKKIWVPEES